MKKTLAMLLLLCMGAVLFAGVSYDYPSWNEICDRWEEDYDFGKDFRTGKAELKAEYETAIRNILPFFEKVPGDADVSLDFGKIMGLAERTTVGSILTYVTDTISIEFMHMRLEKDGLHAYAAIYNYNINDDEEPVPLIWLTFEDFVFKSDGTFISGQCKDYDYDNLLLIDDYDMISYSLLESHIETRNGRYVIVCNDLRYYGDMYVPNTYEHTCLKIGSAVIDWNGNFLSYAPCTEEQYIKIGRCDCLFTRTELLGDKIIGEGQYTIPKYKLTVKSNNIVISLEDEDVDFSNDTDVEYTYEFQDFKFRGRGLYWTNYQTVTLYNSELLLFGQVLPVGSVTLRSSGWDHVELVNSKDIPGTIQTQILGPRDHLSSLRLTDEGLCGTLFSEFPEPYGGQGFEYEYVRINPNGTVEPWDDDYYYISNSSRKLDIGALRVYAEYAWQDSEGFHLSDASLTMPDNCVISGLREGSLTLGYDGTITTDVNFSGGAILKSGTILDGPIKFTKDTFSLEGGFWLPSAVTDKFSGSSGMRFKFSLNTDGSVKSLEAHQNGGYYYSIPDAPLSLVFDGYSFAIDQRSTEKGLLPAEGRLVLENPRFSTGNNTTLPSRIDDIAKRSTICFTMDGTLCYKMPEMSNWEELKLNEENLFNTKGR